MNKNAIQKYAIWARNELIEQVAQRAYQYGINEGGYGDENAAVISGRVLTEEEKRQRHSFVIQIQQQGYRLAIEEVAYTWFNRFVALRFMEVNDYLPTHVRVFSDASGGFAPEILKDVLHLDLPGLDKAKVSELLNANKTDELYRYLLLTQCNALNDALPEMFERLGSYTEMLLPNNILRTDGVLGHLVSDIPEDDWKDAVQIIGWMYQYYNTEPKQAVFDGLKKNVKISKDKIPAATQLFTPDWIVRYMVENSLGRLWLERYPDSKLKANWKYYLDEAEQTPEVAEKLRVLRSENAVKSPEDIRLIDPCMGSGHILVYAFDVLIQIYESVGVSPRDAAKLILEKNIYGLDIDRRAYQLAYFAVMMKARQYNRRILNENLKIHVLPIVESNDIDLSHIDFLGKDMEVSQKTIAEMQVMSLIEQMRDAKEFGSLISPQSLSVEHIEEFINSMTPVQQMSFSDVGVEDTQRVLRELLAVAKILGSKYDVVVTNPPYMGNKGMSAKLSEYVKQGFPDSKSDLFAVFVERCEQLLKPTGYQAMITQHAWMFLSSFEKLRSKLLLHDIINMAHLGARAFEEIGGEVVQTTAFVMSARKEQGFLGTYARLVDFGSQNEKETAFLNGEHRHMASADNFAKIPGSPVAYWVSENMLRAFENESIYKVSVAPSQNVTGDNSRFVRKHWELSYKKIDVKDSWIFYAKGGGYRKWIGNLDDVVDWTPAARQIYQFGDGKHASQIINKDYWYRKGITWGLITSNIPSFRVMPEGATFDKGGSTIIVNEDVYLFVLGLLNSNVFLNIVKIFNPTLNFQIRDICNMPLICNSKIIIDGIVQVNISLSCADWDAFETSWDFDNHPLIDANLPQAPKLYDYADRQRLTREGKEIPDWTTHPKYGIEYFVGEGTADTTIENAFNIWDKYADERFNTLKANEEELNRIFIDIYGLQDELTPEVEDKDVTVRRADLGREIRSLISYAVGCMFGRYSLDVDGLAFAGGEWDAAKYRTFPADKDNIIPVCDDEYFDDDIVGRFVDFVKTVYGDDTLEENLKYIADALGGSGTPREVIRKYFLNDFYKDHLKIYQKRPIYWLFDSGKKNGFKALIYMHRYGRDLLAKLRTDYVHEQQERYRTQIGHIDTALNTATGAERARLLKQQDKLSEQSKEIGAYEESIHHLADRSIEIDLDDGVKVNYAKFEDVLAKLK